MHNQAPINRRKSTRIYVGKVPIGDGAPIAVQSMTNTRTTDVEATVNQIKALERVGVDIVRVSVPTMDAAEAFKLIKQQVNVPLVADIHFDYRIALQVAEYGVDCLRINPGNIGNESRIRSVVDCARDKNIPIRIGVNGGSLEKDLQEKYGEPTPEALLESAMRHVDILDRLNFDQFKVSVKASDVFLAVQSYRLLASRIDQPLHLGITEAGGARSGSVKSAIGLGMLLSEGIGDTLRISLAADPVEEVKVGFDILKSLRIRARHQLYRLPDLFASGVRRDRHGERAGAAPGGYHHADGRFDHRLRGERPGRSAGVHHGRDRRPQEERLL